MSGCQSRTLLPSCSRHAKLQARNFLEQRVEQRHTGVVVGAGFETMLTPNLGLRLEGLSFNPDKEQYDFAASGPLPASSATFDFHRTYVRAGLSYHFN
jgi:opacity protein-like surface antigen